MSAKLRISGNSAVAYGALSAGVAVAAGYPGTPSSEALTELLRYSESSDPAPYVEWSTNEKVALEVAVGAAWAGQRAMATMKMSGANVALDTLISAAYSGTIGGLVVYIADDPGAEAGMPEQDTRLTALFTTLPVLEPSNPRQAYRLTQLAFDISEQIQLPVILRSVTTLAHAVESFEIDTEYRPLNREASFQRDITRFTKAGARICLDQHQSLLERNSIALELYRQHQLNRLIYSGTGGRSFPGETFSDIGSSGNGAAISPAGTVLASGVLSQSVLELHERFPELKIAGMEAVLPVDEEFFKQILDTSSTVLVLEELEPVIERHLRSFAQRSGWTGRIIGKEDGTLPRVGRYTRDLILLGITRLVGEKADGKPAGQALEAAASLSPAPVPPPDTIKHPITFCEGCPHRGTYMALNHALRKTGLGQKKTVVTGDIGCTILGMNPPFHSCWTEISMGSSIGTAQGFSRGGIRKPVVATIGDSTFFHGGIPQLINAVQHRTDLLLIILDNGWTSMTGFQVNPGTASEHQQGGARRVEIEKIVDAMGVDMLQIMNPFRQDKAVEILSEALTSEGVRVVISKAECALTRLRREPAKFKYVIDPEKCTFCRACILQTGCPALFVDEKGEKPVTAIDWNSCTGCALCYSTCRFDAISPKGANK